MPKSKYEDIYQILRARIEDGTYSYGSLLPSENRLILDFACSRNTIRRALSGLIEDGSVQAIHGKGVRVIYQPVSRAAFAMGGIESFAETARRNHLSVVTRVIRFQTMTADESLAAVSGFPLGEEICYIQRVRYLDGKARILDHNMFRTSLVPGLTPEIAEQSIYSYIEKDLGMQIVTSKRTITVEHATPADEELLDLDGYNCLAVVTGQTYNSDGALFEYTRSLHQPDFFSFHDTATRKKSALTEKQILPRTSG